MSVDIRELMLTGAHFGHRTRFWNPQMASYIYGEYHSTHIINLDITIENLNKAAEFLKSVASSGGTVLYLCTKDAGGDILRREAESVKMPFVNRRWLGGILTNFKTTRNSVETLVKMEDDRAGGALKYMTKKEGIKFLAMLDKLERVIGGIRKMKELPDALFVIDAGWHKGAIAEANKLGIPVVAVVDTNHSPNNIDYVIPGNDDSKQAINIYVGEITKAIAAGRAEYEAANPPLTAAKPDADRMEARKPKPKKVVVAASTLKTGKQPAAAADKPADKAEAKTESKEADKPAETKAAKPAAKKAADKTAETKAKKPAAKSSPSAKTDSNMAAQVKELREMTGFGIMECKKALVECGGDLAKAQAFLKERSGGKAAGVSGRRSSEGRLAFAEGDGIGWLAESRCETDFVARGEDMAAFTEALAKAAAEGGADDVANIKLASGKTAEEARQELVMKVGENISVGRVVSQKAADGGGVASYVHTDKKTAAMCAFSGDAAVARDVCMHIAAMKPDNEAELMKQDFVKDSKKTVGEMLSEAKTSISGFQLLIVGIDG